MTEENFEIARELTHEQMNIKNQLQIRLMHGDRKQLELSDAQKNKLALDWMGNSKRFRVVFDTLITNENFDLAGAWNADQDGLLQLIKNRMEELPSEVEDVSLEEAA